LQQNIHYIFTVATVQFAIMPAPRLTSCHTRSVLNYSSLLISSLVFCI